MSFHIQTKQLDGSWISHTEITYHRLAAAVIAADNAHAHWLCPKRVISIQTLKVAYTVGDTPEHAAFVARVNAIIEAQANPSERFNMPTAWESRLNTWRAMEINGNNTEYQCEVIQYIDARIPAYGAYRYDHELMVSDTLGMYMMGEEL